MDTGTSGEPIGDDAAPMERQRELMELLSQETRHSIVQTVLGHPSALASEAEIAYFQPDKSRKAVADQIDRLVEGGILDQYIHKPNESTRGLPTQFYGPSPNGVEILSELGYLNSVPMMRAIHQKTSKPDRIQRHEDAPRPTLPDAVRYSLRLGDDDESKDSDDIVADGPDSSSIDGITLTEDRTGVVVEYKRGDSTLSTRSLPEEYALSDILSMEPFTSAESTSSNSPSARHR